MALRQLMLKNKIDKKRAELNALLEKDKDFQTREEELETAIGEATTDEEQTAVSESVEAFETEKQAHEDEKERLSGEISDLEAELAEAEKEPPADTRTKNETKERTERKMEKTINIRSLPMNVRAIDALSYTEREALVNRDDVKEFLSKVREAGKHNRAVTGASLTVPVVVLDLIAENMYRYSKLLNRVRVRNVRGQARQTIAGTVPEAVWTEMCGAINELNFVFNQITVDGYKVAGYVPVCNSLLEDSDIDLAAYLVEMISESIGYAIDKAILYGKGATSHMPLGIVTRLAQTSAPDGYPANAPAWVDLHTSNIIKIDSTDMTPIQFLSAFAIAAGNTFSRYARGRRFWAMNSKTYAQIQAMLIASTAQGEYVSRVSGVMPITEGDIDVLEFIPDGDIIGGYGDLYLWVERGALSIESSEHVQFIQDNTVFRGKERADGMPVIPQSFVAININNEEVTTVMDFAADNANDADLDNVTIGSETLNPTFDPDVLSYTMTASSASGKVDANPAQASAQVSMSYQGKTYKAGSNITWTADDTAHPLTITVKNGNAVKVYTIQVTKASLKEVLNGQSGKADSLEAGPAAYHKCK